VHQVAADARELAGRIAVEGHAIGKPQEPVLLEPIAAGKIGLAVIAGVVPVRLQVDPAQF
jgi:repressor of nif and glnA expression